ncbi:MAG TPA: homocysteine S-methyltransferase family protein [Fimbriimonadaceae bacterium]|nr:homocysteine S-methyltransferase family protein [Fimbriimonadaceae bacterium]
MGSQVLEALAERVLVFDGAMGTQIHASNLQPADFVIPANSAHAKVAAAAERMGATPLDGCNELLNVTRPDVIEAIHSNYFAAGADLVETNTFGSSSIVLAEYGIEELVYELSLEAAKIARRAADKHASTKPRYVVGAIGPGTKLVSLGQTSWQELETSYFDGYRGLLEGGADALLLETTQDLLMVKACIVAATRAMAEFGRSVPFFVQVTMEQTGTMLLGSEIGAALNMIEAFPQVTAFGINCATGPVEMAPHVRFLSQNSTRPISVQPNAGLPEMEAGRAVYKLTPEQLAEHHSTFVKEYGVALCGGCCGTTPDHIRAVADAVGGRKHSAGAHWRQVAPLFPGFDFTMKTDEQAAALNLVGCSSLYQFQPYEQDSSFLIVGEKTNANGSRAFKEMLAAENWEGLTELARELEGEGSHLLDVCAAYVGRNEVADMKHILANYNRHTTVPIMVDSTEAPVIEASLQSLAGKPLVNSINFEDGGGRVESVLELCRKYGAGVVALTIDEDGMAKSVERKLAIADRLLDATRAYGLPDHDVFIDALTFTLGSGDEEFRGAGVATIEAIKAIRARHPRVNTILGVSNISFGLKPAVRKILNSAFLHYAREAGLTSAIVHFSKIVPETQIEPEVWQIASDLVFDRRKYSA